MKAELMRDKLDRILIGYKCEWEMPCKETPYYELVVFRGDLGLKVLLTPQFISRVGEDGTGRIARLINRTFESRNHVQG